jgi:hypothetical protein
MASGHGLLGRPEATRRRMEAHAGASLYTTAGDYGIFRNYAIAYPGSRTGVVYLANSFYGLGVTSALVARSVGGQALGGVALNYRPYDSPLYRFVWDVQEKGPAAVNELDRLRREHPGLFERDWIGFFASPFLEAGMTAQALALFESDLRDHPRSGSSPPARRRAPSPGPAASWCSASRFLSRAAWQSARASRCRAPR